MKESWVFSLVAVILAITALICSLCANSNHAATYEDNDIGKVTIGLWKMCNGELGCYDIRFSSNNSCPTLSIDMKTANEFMGLMRDSSKK
ncbi:uncharacterized protein LOC142342212 isoform X4 [Convolutriloba macropyga]|uniref:uncharacterized protein LOC142342212 isoform X4 n=1 Tax=Convolutriloba macropyga TaxID=536237 RepID=UPI003F51B15F